MAVGCRLDPPQFPSSSAPGKHRATRNIELHSSATEKMEGSSVTNSVNIIDSGKVQEIVGASDPYQLYVVRLTAESNDTKVEACSMC